MGLISPRVTGRREGSPPVSALDGVDQIEEPGPVIFRKAGLAVVLAIPHALPVELMAALVAIALLGPLSGALTGAFAQADQRFAATITLAATASGVAFAHIGAAFWGLLAGLVIWGLERAFRR